MGGGSDLQHSYRLIDESSTNVNQVGEGGPDLNT